MEKTQTITVSMPKTMVQRTRRLARNEQRTLSEFIREVIRTYENRARQRFTYQELGDDSLSWEKLDKELKRVSKLGRTNVNLSKFVIEDRKRRK